jgi:hypothetical protein
MTDTTAPVQASATAPVVTVVRPTNGLVREYLKAKGVLAAESRKTITVEDKVAFLGDFPETTRALAREAGLSIGNRGVIATATIQAVAESI